MTPQNKSQNVDNSEENIISVDDIHEKRFDLAEKLENIEHVLNAKRRKLEDLTIFYNKDGKKIDIEFDASRTCIDVDGATIYLLPDYRFSFGLGLSDEEEFLISSYMVAHEVEHKNSSDLKILEKTKDEVEQYSNFATELANLFEDAYVDHIKNTRYPGLKQVDKSIVQIMEREGFFDDPTEINNKASQVQAALFDYKFNENIRNFSDLNSQVRAITAWSSQKLDEAKDTNNPEERRNLIINTIKTIIDNLPDVDEREQEMKNGNGGENGDSGESNDGQENSNGQGEEFINTEDYDENDNFDQKDTQDFDEQEVKQGSQQIQQMKDDMEDEEEQTPSNGQKGQNEDKENQEEEEHGGSNSQEEEGEDKEDSSSSEEASNENEEDGSEKEENKEDDQGSSSQEEEDEEEKGQESSESENGDESETEEGQENQEDDGGESNNEGDNEGEQDESESSSNENQEDDSGQDIEDVVEDLSEEEDTSSDEEEIQKGIEQIKDWFDQVEDEAIRMRKEEQEGTIENKRKDRKERRDSANVKYQDLIQYPDVEEMIYQVEEAFKPIKSRSEFDYSERGQALDVDRFIEQTLGSDEDRIFEEERLKEPGDRIIGIALDMSGSVNEESAKKPFVAIERATDIIGDEICAESFHRGTTDLIVSPNEEFQPQYLDSISSGGNTPTAKGIHEVKKLCEGSSKNKKVLIVITDGKPNQSPNYNCGAVEAASMEVKEAKRDGFKVIGIGIEGSVSERKMERMFGNNYSLIDNIGNLGEEMLRIYKNQLEFSDEVHI